MIKMNQDRETIAAVSTPPGEGAIGVVRLSGPGAVEAGGKVFAPAGGDAELRPRYMHYGRFMDPACGEVIDTGLFVIMPGPGSATGEDVVEMHCHGGPLVVGRVLEAALAAGARLAEPGEFTRRAFMNGKLDLAQAEAVIDVIRAQTESSLASARGRLEGVFSSKVNSVKDPLVELLSGTEAELDFPEEEDVELVPKERLLGALAAAADDIEKMLATFREGSALTEGVRALILGRPNVGKSSLLNLLLKQERAIVTEVPGTTRDVIEEVVNIRGVPMRLMDTAGLRDTTDRVESIGVELARSKIEGADLVLFVVDASAGRFDEDLGLVEAAQGKKTIVVANKIDLAGDEEKNAVVGAFGPESTALVSVKDGTGVEGLLDAVYKESVGHAPGAVEARPGELVVSLRHKKALEAALEGIDRTARAARDGVPGEFVATELRWAVDRLGEITGETTTDDILDRIFSNFCIGK